MQAVQVITSGYKGHYLQDQLAHQLATSSPVQSSALELVLSRGYITNFLPVAIFVANQNTAEHACILHTAQVL
eukprot:scaffold39028_cov16-Tisochrysis_lutea.AAC.1